jgi:hypothetical protein
LQRTPSITLSQYYEAFYKTVSGVLAGVTALSPLATLWLPGNASRCAFPPLGEAEAIARVVIVSLACGVTLIMFVWTGPRITRRIVIAFILAAVAGCLSILLYLGFVRRIEIPTANTAVCVSIEYRRTDFSKVTFGTISDEDLLRQRGVTDEEIRRLWTKGSVQFVRLGLFLAYCGFVLSLVAAFSLTVRYQLTEGIRGE